MLTHDVKKFKNQIMNLESSFDKNQNESVVPILTPK